MQSWHAFHKLFRLWKDRYLAQSVKLSKYKAIVLATLLYGCESWAVSKDQLQKLGTFHMRCLRRICGLTLWQRKRNQDILAACKMETIEALVKFRRLRWLGHIARMEDDRLPKQLLFAQLEKKSSVGPGRPIKCWTDYVRDDLRTISLAYDWYRLAQNREKWREKIKTILVHI